MKPPPDFHTRLCILWIAFTAIALFLLLKTAAILA